MRLLDRWGAFRCPGSLFVIALAALAVLGCNKSALKLYPVSGKVFYKNQPASGAQVVLQPQEQPESEEAKAKQPLAHGTVADDGTFVVRSEPHGAGAVPGKYNVFITWYATDPRDPEKHFNKLPLKYANQEKPAFVVTVKEERNELEPFQLN